MRVGEVWRRARTGIPSHQAPCRSSCELPTRTTKESGINYLGQNGPHPPRCGPFAYLGENMPLFGEAKRKYQREWMAARRKEWIDSRGGCCAACGSTQSLEVDHIDPAKKTMQPASIWSRNQAAVALELANCQVLCEPCHLLKTFGSVGIKHGTTTGYKHHKCRCLDCRRANTASVQRQRAAA